MAFPLTLPREEAIVDITNTAVETVPVVVQNSSKLAKAGKAALTVGKAVGGAVVSGVIIGSLTGVTIVAAGVTMFGVFKGANWMQDKWSTWRSKKDQAPIAEPAPA